MRRLLFALTTMFFSNLGTTCIGAIQWSAPVTLAPPQHSSPLRCAVDSDGNWVFAWIEGNGIFYSRTTDPASTAGEKMSIVAEAVVPRHLVLACSANGTFLAAWIAQESESTLSIWCSQSLDAGQTWTDKRRVVEMTGGHRAFDLSMAGAGDGTWVLAMSTTILFPGDPAEVEEIEIAACISRDDGATWAPPARVSQDNPYAKRFTIPTVVTDGSGTWTMAYWGGPRSPGILVPNVMLIVSNDNALSWHDQQLIEQLNGIPVPIALAVDGMGLRRAVWAGPIHPVPVVRMRSAALDVGQTSWSAPAPFPNMEHQDGHSPCLAYRKAGKWSSAWSADTESISQTRLFFSQSDDSANWEHPIEPASQIEPESFHSLGLTVSDSNVHVITWTSGITGNRRYIAGTDVHLPDVTLSSSTDSRGDALIQISNIGDMPADNVVIRAVAQASGNGRDRPVFFRRFRNIEAHESVTIRLRIGRLLSRTGSILVQTDPQNSVIELDESNNTVLLTK